MFKQKQKSYILLRPIIDEIMKKNIPIEYTTSQNTTCFLYASVLYIKFTSFLNINVKDKCTELLGERGRNEILEKEFSNYWKPYCKIPEVREYIPQKTYCIDNKPFVYVFENSSCWGFRGNFSQLCSPTPCPVPKMLYIICQNPSGGQKNRSG